MKIKEIFKDERPREKLIKNGVSSLSDAELLAILLRCGDKNKSALEISNEILNKNNGLEGLLKMSYEEIIKISGIKEAKASIILSAFEICRRAMSKETNKETYDNSEKLYHHLKPIIEKKSFESICVIYLNSKLKIIKEKIYEMGGARDAIIPGEQILKEGILCGAFALVISHNHPSGDPNPSKSDIKETLKLSNALAVLNIMLMDHIIIGDNSYYSFLDNEII